MNMDCVEKQLVLNRLGETSLNDDIVEIIKEFAFKSFMRMEAERKKKGINTEFENLDRNNYDCWPKWSVIYSAYAPSDNYGWKTKQIGSIMCGYCGNYQAHLHLSRGASEWPQESWVPCGLANKCAPRARCSCGIGEFWESDVHQVANEVHTWPPVQGSSFYEDVGSDWSGYSVDSEDPYEELEELGLWNP